MSNSNIERLRPSSTTARWVGLIAALPPIFLLAAIAALPDPLAVLVGVTLIVISVAIFRHFTAAVVLRESDLRRRGWMHYVERRLAPATS